MSAVQGFGAELEVVVSSPPSPVSQKRTRVRGRGHVAGKRVGFQAGVTGTAVSKAEVEGRHWLRLNARPLLPPSSPPPSQRLLS